MRRNHPSAEFRKSDQRQAAVGFSVQFGAGMALRALNVLFCSAELRPFARAFHYRHLTACLQIAAIALMLTVGPRAAIESQEIPAAGSSQILFTDAANCNAQVGNEAPAHPRPAHAQCCVTCTAAGRDFLTFLIASIYIAGYCFARAAYGLVAYFTDREFFPRVLGWASSWSSRAPPVSL
jgi:hypothetical protein